MISTKQPLQNTNIYYIYIFRNREETASRAQAMAFPVRSLFLLVLTSTISRVDLSGVQRSNTIKKARCQANCITQVRLLLVDFLMYSRRYNEFES